MHFERDIVRTHSRHLGDDQHVIAFFHHVDRGLADFLHHHTGFGLPVNLDIAEGLDLHGVATEPDFDVEAVDTL